MLMPTHKNMLKIIKRSGQSVEFERSKILNAIKGASKDADNQMKESEINNVASFVEGKIRDNGRDVHVEEIQNMVEDALMDLGYKSVAREYIKYRKVHEMRRNAAVKLMDDYRDLLFAKAEDMDLKRDNANINADTSMGIMLKLGTEGAKNFVNNYALDEDVAKADREDWIHIHDKDFSLITFNCCQIDLAKLLKGGFCTGHGFVREPNSIRAASACACVAIQSNQNEMFGGQSINALDFALAPYVHKSFKKALMRILLRMEDWLGRDTYHIIPQSIKEDIIKKLIQGNNIRYGLKGEGVEIAAKAIHAEIFGEKNIEKYQSFREAKKLYHMACEDVEEETKQAMEAMIHNFNTLHSRAGAQVPFSSVNFGLDTSPEGRLVSKWLLEAQYAGMGNGETSIFPITVFQLKAGVNYNPGDPNYDLFKRACEVSAKRLYPKQNWGLLSCTAA